MLSKRLIGLALLQAATLPAQVERSPLPGWQAVGKVRPGEAMRVVLVSGRTIEGVFESWSVTSVSIGSGASMMSLKATEVKEISVRQSGRRWKAAAIASGIGFGVGYAIGTATAGAITDRNNPSFGARVEAGARVGVVGAGIGALIGALTGGARSKTIYRAR
jgi:hypothetical protein